MTSFYDDVDIDDMRFDAEKQVFTYPCPCGDKFQISVEDLEDGEEVARCPSCSLIIRVVYDPDGLAAVIAKAQESLARATSAPAAPSATTAAAAVLSTEQ